MLLNSWDTRLGGISICTFLFMLLLLKELQFCAQVSNPFPRCLAFLHGCNGTRNLSMLTSNNLQTRRLRWHPRLHLHVPAPIPLALDRPTISHQNSDWRRFWRTKHVSEFWSISNLLNRTTSNSMSGSPMSMYDFYMYLKHIEHSPENLEFYIWYGN